MAHADKPSPWKAGLCEFEVSLGSLEASLGQPRLHEMLPQKEQTQFILTTCDTDVNYFSNIRIGLITSYL